MKLIIRLVLVCSCLLIALQAHSQSQEPVASPVELRKELELSLQAHFYECGDNLYVIYGGFWCVHNGKAEPVRTADGADLGTWSNSEVIPMDGRLILQGVAFSPTDRRDATIGLYAVEGSKAVPLKDADGIHAKVERGIRSVGIRNRDLNGIPFVRADEHMLHVEGDTVTVIEFPEGYNKNNVERLGDRPLIWDGYSSRVTSKPLVYHDGSFQALKDESGNELTFYFDSTPAFSAVGDYLIPHGNTQSCYYVRGTTAVPVRFHQTAWLDVLMGSSNEVIAVVREPLRRRVFQLKDGKPVPLEQAYRVGKFGDVTTSHPLGAEVFIERSGSFDVLWHRQKDGYRPIKMPPGEEFDSFENITEHDGRLLLVTRLKYRGPGDKTDDYCRVYMVSRNGDLRPVHSGGKTMRPAATYCYSDSTGAYLMVQSEVRGKWKLMHVPWID